MDLDERFEQYNSEYIKFDRVKNKKSKRPDLHGFLLLDELFPGERDMVCSAEHDEIWLDVKDEQLETLDNEQLIELIRCGMRHSEYGGLCMFV